MMLQWPSDSTDPEFHSFYNIYIDLFKVFVIKVKNLLGGAESHLSGEVNQLSLRTDGLGSTTKELKVPTRE